MTTFPDHSPDLESTYDRQELLNRAEFGDGYSQVSGDGIRPYKDGWNLKFSGRTWAVIEEIKDFLDGLSGASFDWQSPLSASATKWKYLESYTVSKQGEDAFSIEFKIEGVGL